jgi:hypothetical protein
MPNLHKTSAAGCGYVHEFRLSGSATVQLLLTHARKLPSKSKTGANTMSLALIKFIEANPELIAEYRRYVVRKVMKIQKAATAKV